jgi:GH25 family lysozyme M1 (1,4-beta-N-acetylmuramidase)
MLLGRGRVLPSRRPREEGEEKSMSEQEGGRLSLKGLAQRLEALARENEQMRSENAELRGEVSALRGSGTRRGEVPALRGSDRRRDKEVASEFEGQVSRRALLSKAGAAVVASVAAGTLLNQREAEAAQAADLERFYAGIKSDTQVEHEFGGMKAGILTPEEFRAEQHAARIRDEANAELGLATIQRDLLDVVFGIDVSKWQGELNWLRIWNEGFRFSGIKATEGPYPNGKKYTDPWYATNAKWSKSRGFVRFPYHFLVDAPIGKQVDHFLNVAGGGWGRGKCPLIDFEAYPGFPSLNPSRGQLFEFLSLLRRKIGSEPLIFVYAGKDYTDSIGGIDLSTFNNVRLWDAAYYLGFKRGYASELWHEIVNAGYQPFAKARWGHRSKKVSQFTSTAKVAGQLMDADAWHGDLHDLRHATGWEAA